MITVKFLRHHSSISLCSQKLLLHEIGSCSTLFHNPLKLYNLHNCKRLLSASSILHGEKPVVLQASEIIPDTPASTLNAIADGLPEPSFAELGIGQSWWPSNLIENLFETIYIHTGSPWWVSIALGTFAVRLITTPLFIYSRKTMMRYTNHHTAITKLRDKMLEGMAQKNLAIQAQSRKRYKDFCKEQKTSPIRMMLSNLPMPVVFISCLGALREMTNLPVPSMANSSFYWISNLLEPDPYYLLPAISGLLVGVNMIISMRLNPSFNATKITIGTISLIPIIAFPLFFGRWSSAFGIYLLVNSAFTSTLSTALSTKRVQTLLDMPPTPTLIKGKDSMMARTMKQSRDRTIQKHEARQIRRMLKDEKKARKKELKKKPPPLYEIGTEAKARKPFVPDFQREWRPPKPNIYEQ